MKDSSAKKQLLLMVLLMVCIYLFDNREVFFDGIRAGVFDVFAIKF